MATATRRSKDPKPGDGRGMSISNAVASFYNPSWRKPSLSDGLRRGRAKSDSEGRRKGSIEASFVAIGVGETSSLRLKQRSLLPAGSRIARRSSARRFVPRNKSRLAISRAQADTERIRKGRRIRVDVWRDDKSWVHEAGRGRWTRTLIVITFCNFSRTDDRRLRSLHEDKVRK